MPIAARDTELLDWVDFKWLMAAEGRPVHLERLQSDRDYALSCLHCGAASHCATLRERSRRLLDALHA